MVYAINEFPNQDNFSQVSFPEGLTPVDVEPDEGDTILVAYNPEWSKVLASACNQLTQFSSWAGDHDEKLLMVNRAILLKILLQTPVTTPDDTVPAPYWDDETDVDDELPVDEQEWYGIVENKAAAADAMTFQQSAVIWLLTGFVALVASPSLPGAIAAAVAFRTLARRFVLAFNRGDIREQFRVIIDAQDYGKVDTDDMTEGDIVELTVDGLDPADYHDILIVVTNPD